MKIFVINLDQDVIRWRVVKSRLEEIGLPFKRVSAVYAKGMVRDEREQQVNQFRWWCATGRPPRDGEIGCALSHFGIYRKMIAEEIPVACVLEDDVVLDSRIAFVLTKLQEVLNPAVPQVALLSNHSDPWQQDPEDGESGFRAMANDKEFRLKPETWDMFTEGYVITRAGAAALLKANYPLITPCDAWPRWVRNGAIELYHAFPTVCSQNKADFASTTVGGGVWVKDMGLVRFCCYRLGRVVGRLLDRILVKIYGY